MSNQHKKQAKTRMKVITEYSIDILLKKIISPKNLSKQVTRKITQANKPALVKQSNVQRRIYDAMLILRGVGFVQLKNKRVCLKEYLFRKKAVKEYLMKHIIRKKKRILKLNRMKRELTEGRRNIHKLIVRNIAPKIKKSHSLSEQIPLKNFCVFQSQANKQDQISQQKIQDNIQKIKCQQLTKTNFYNVKHCITNIDCLQLIFKHQNKFK